MYCPSAAWLIKTLAIVSFSDDTTASHFGVAIQAVLSAELPRLRYRWSVSAPATTIARSTWLVPAFCATAKVFTAPPGCLASTSLLSSVLTQPVSWPGVSWVTYNSLSVLTENSSEQPLSVCSAVNCFSGAAMSASLKLLISSEE
ncbi:hypothetical protein D3C86_1716510 [compost metagenome]